MPGVLKRSHDLVDPDGRDEASAAPDPKRVAREHINGEPAPSINGARTTTSGAGFPDTGIVPNPSLSAAARALADAAEDDAAAANDPPPIHHIAENYVPLAKLVERLAQDTHNELEQVIGELADLQATQVNGYGSAHAVQVNVQKKERLFGFAQNARSKFIKLLVLSQWSRDSAAVSKLIDLHSWILFRREEYRNAVNWMGELKRMTATMKLPPPDLRTALEVLSTGRANWISNPIDIAPEPMSAEEMLHGLRTINTELTIRLNLHESIPPEMMDFSIASGRATFRVANEFELDLSIGNEDPDSQLWFVDFRFAFEPCAPDLPEGPLRAHVEARVNDVLATEGLAGCYRFLHELVVTHKLSVLRQQAFDLARGSWSEHIKVEPVHRALVVQYWINRPGRKSWIEIGVRRHRRKDGVEGDTSGLGVRWHRHGQEIPDHSLEVADTDLSLEALLKHVVATHTNHIFTATKRALKRDPIYERGILTVKHRAHRREPAECALSVQMSAHAVVKLSQEPISGFFAIAPTSETHSHAEMEINRLADPAVGLHPRLSTLRCRNLAQQVRQLARVRRWQVMNVRTNQETVQRIFGVEQALVAFFRLPLWERHWLLAVATNGAGDKWWLVETQDAPRNPSPLDFAGNAYQPLKKSLRVNLQHNAVLVFEAQHAHLSTVERTAAAVLAQFLDARALTAQKRAYRQLPPRWPSRRLVVPELLLRFSPVAAAATAAAAAAGGERAAWCNDIVKSVFVGISRLEGQTTTVVTGQLAHRIPDIDRFHAHMDAALAFHPTNGQFSFRLKSPIGASSIAAVDDHLHRIGCLVRLIHATAKHHLHCSRLALDCFTFNYAPAATDMMGMMGLASGLSATVTFVTAPTLPGTSSSSSTAPPATSTNTTSTSTSTTITSSAPAPSTAQATIQAANNAPISTRPIERLSLPHGNPHLRILDHLNRVLNSGRHGFDATLELLRSTLELMQSFSAMEQRPRPTSGGRAPRIYILPRSAACYQVRYVAPGVKVGFEAQLRRQGDESVVWLHEFVVIGPHATTAAAAAAANSAASAKALSASPAKGRAGNNNPSFASSATAAAGAGAVKEPSSADLEAEKARFGPLRATWNALCKTRGPGFEGLGIGLCAPVNIPGAVAALMEQVDEALSSALEQVVGPASSDDGGEDAEGKDREPEKKEEAKKQEKKGKGASAKEAITLE